MVELGRFVESEGQELPDPNSIVFLQKTLLKMI